MLTTNYNLEPSGLLPGEPADNGNKDVISKAAEFAIDFGLALVRSDDSDQVRTPINKSQTLVFSADLVTSNVINGTVNGEAIDAVTFASTHLATMQAIADEIEALDPALTATVGGANNRTITVTSDGSIPVVAASFVVTLGASQATVTIADNSIEVFVGISAIDHTREQALTGGSTYAIGDAVGVAKEGRWVVQIEEDIAIGDSVFMRVKDASNKVRGAFRNDADSGAAVAVSGVRWAVGGTAAKGTAVLELNTQF